jgi:hypothetical protein
MPGVKITCIHSRRVTRFGTIAHALRAARPGIGRVLVESSTQSSDHAGG